MLTIPGLQFDLGDDVLAFARKRLAIARDLLKHQETRALKPEQNYAVLRRVVSYVFRDVARSAGILARQIGGVRALRDVLLNPLKRSDEDDDDDDMTGLIGVTGDDDEV